MVDICGNSRLADAEMLLKDLPAEQRRKYYEMVFHGVDDRTIQEFEECLLAYEEYNGSLFRAADALCIHKNTLQYRLNKI